MFKGSDLPPIRTLRAFIIVAHHQSFSKAAEELCVTQSAVSKQVASLEQFVEQPLIERQANGIVLTEYGTQYLPKVMEALEIIEYATASLKQRSSKAESLVISAPPSFVALWMLPQAESFRAQHPDIQLQFVTHEVSGEKAQCDIEIRCLPLASYYEHSQLLLEERLVVVTNQQYCFRNLEAPFKQQKVISHTTRPQLWQRYFESLHLSIEPNFHPLSVEHFYLALEAVKRSDGIALVPEFLARESIMQQEVFPISQQVYPSGYGYYLSVPNYRKASRKVALFCQWLNAELSDK